MNTELTQLMMKLETRPPLDEAGGIAATTIQSIYTVRPLRQRLRVLRVE